MSPPHSEASYLGVYRVILALVGVGVPLAGVLAWSEGAFYDVFAVRIGVAVVSAVLFAGTWTEGPLRTWIRELTLLLSWFLVGWFLWIARHHGVTFDDVVGLVPLVLISSLLLRAPRELAIASIALFSGVGATYWGLEAPVFPMGIVLLIFQVLLLSLGWLSIRRAQLEQELFAANLGLEARVRERTSALEASEAEARRASEAKSVFLANMSHELRTPLTAILGHVEMAREELDGREPEVETDLERSEQAAHHLLGLIDDLLDLARIEAGRMELTTAVVPVETVAQHAVRLVSTAMTARGNSVELEVPEQICVSADPDRLRQILVNLLSNAAKFTERGKVRVRAESSGDDVRISVSDTGIGMPASVVATVFERFSQGDASSTRRYGGTGLGLAICQELAMLMGGRITVQSEEGVGSTFTVVLPAS
ncbi:MAG: HAMP domain-containing sensor histidine kinase [Myxococcota bacterium]